MKKKADIAVFDFTEGDDDGPRPRLMHKIRQSFLSGARKRKKTNVPVSVSPDGIGTRTRARKGVLPVTVLEDSRKPMSRKEKSSEAKGEESEKAKQRQMEEDAKRHQTLLQEAIRMSRLQPLVFPPDDPDPVTITEADIDVLRPSAFLNDTIIDFYVKYLQTTLSEQEKRKSYFFNSFFFTKLVELSTLSGDEAKAGFARLEKWTKDEDIFEKDFIFIPVNRSCHWSLLVICYLNDMVLQDSDLHTSSTCIIHFDSFDGFHADIEPYIRNYLGQEWSRRASKEQLQYQFDQMRFIKAKVPQQDNLHDCGLFLLHYVEQFLERGYSCARGQLSFITKDWFDPAAASAKRSNILRLIHEMYVEKLDSQDETSGNVPHAARDESRLEDESFLDDDEELVMLHG